MNKITKLALTIPAVFALIGGMALTQVAAQSGTTSNADTPQATAQLPLGQRGRGAPGGQGTQGAQTGQVNPDLQGQVPPDGGPGGPGGRGGPGERGGHGGPTGAVTAVSDTSVSMTDQQQQLVTATLSANTTVVQFTTQVTGTLSDIKVGANIQVDGRPTGTGALDAQRVTILPSGERGGGPVSAVDGSSISVDARQTVMTITTSSGTEFYVNGKLGTIADVTAGKFVDAFGAKQSDGSLAATTVVINDRPARPQGGPGRGNAQGAPRGCQPDSNNTNAPAPNAPAPNATVVPGNA